MLGIGVGITSVPAQSVAGAWYSSFAPTLMYDFRDLSAGAVASVDSTGSNTLALVQATGSAQPQAEADTPYALGGELLSDPGMDNGCGVDWNCGTGWSMAAGVASCDGSQTAASNLSENFIGAENTKHFIVYDVINRTAGAIRFKVRGTPTSNVASDGTYTQIITSVSSPVTGPTTADANFIGDVDNASVKEVTDEGMGLFFDGGDSLSGAQTLAQLGVTTKVGLAAKVFVSKYDAGTIIGKGFISVSAATASFSIGISATGNLVVTVSDGTTWVQRTSASPLAYGKHNLIANIDLDGDTVEAWSNDSIIINTTAGGITSFNDANDMTTAGQTMYQSFMTMKNDAFTADERAIINAQ